MGVLAPAVGGTAMLGASLVDDPSKRQTDRVVGELLLGSEVVAFALDGIVYLVNRNRSLESDVGPEDVDHHVEPSPCASPPRVVRLVPPWDTGAISTPFGETVTRFPIDWLAASFDPTDTDAATELLGRSWTIAADGWTATHVTPAPADVSALLAQAVEAVKAAPQPQLDVQLVMHEAGELRLEVTNVGRTAAYGVVAKVGSSEHVMGHDDLSVGFVAPGAHASTYVDSVEGEASRDSRETVEWRVEDKLGTWHVEGKTELRIPAVPL
jgi:hypothetical protein